MTLAHTRCWTAKSRPTPVRRRRAIGLFRPAVASVAAVLAACGGDGATSSGEPKGPTSPPVSYTPGTSYFGRASYIEYIAGNLPVILSAPHGGTLRPAEIPDRTAGTTVRDMNTEELARAISAAFFVATGKYPHVVINRLHRAKLDANREIQEAAQGDAEAQQAWQEFHDFLSEARGAVLAQHGKGFYIDLHGHGHEIQRLELGYLLEASDLVLSDAALDASASYERESSVRTLSEASSLGFAALLRGPSSLGALYEREGYPSVPSPGTPNPGTEPYFTGGYNTDVHGCNDGGTICGIQIEANLTGVRDNADNRARFAAATVKVLQSYLSTHVGLTLSAGTTVCRDASGERQCQGAVASRASRTLTASP